MDALGMVEVFGFTTAICCADIAAKAADVKIIALDKNKPLAGDDAVVPLIMNVKIEGSVAAVEEAVNAAKAHAISKNLFVTSHIIPRPGIGTEKLAALSDVGRDRWVDKKDGSVKAPKAETKQETAKAPSAEAKKETDQINLNDITREAIRKAESAEEKKPRGRRPKTTK